MNKIILVLIMLLSGCTALPQEKETLNIVTASYPVYDWLKAIVGDQAAVTLIMDDHADMHNASPSVSDIALVSNADLFVYIGGESDAWVNDALRNVQNEDQLSLNLIEVLGDWAKEVSHEDHDHDHEYDEHIWLSLRNAQRIVQRLVTEISLLDSENEAYYQENAASYLEQLADLDAAYQAMVDQAVYDTLVFGDRFPFLYLLEDYGLQHYAAFSGCHAESEASFETIVFLAGRIDDLGLGHIMTIETSDQAIAQAVRQNTLNQDQTILVLNSMQAKQNDSYLDIMRANLDVLREALQS